MGKSEGIQKVCVIGGGTMGSGIAAQVANAGIPVLLLDIVGDEDDRNRVVEQAINRIKKSDPPLLMKPENIELIEIGNLEDDLAEVSSCDWIVEAIVERLEIKRTLYRNLLPHLKEGAYVSSNTSTIPISLLMEDMPDELKTRFCITHFFNPVRYMRLLELVEGPETGGEVMETLADFNDRMLGKGVVQCADTPGFLGNRVGVFAMQAAIHEATEMGLEIEQADQLFGRPMGIPKTGCFGLYDLIGIDLMADVVRSLRSILPQGDPFHAVGAENPLVNKLVEEGYTGNKGKGGFYRKVDGKQEAIDLASGQWRPRNKELSELAQRGEAEGLSVLIEGEDKLSVFAWRVLAHIFTYSASLVPEVTRTPQDIDDAMKLGYNWVQGPFEMLDELGPAKVVARLQREGWSIPDFLRDIGEETFYRVNETEKTLEVRNWSDDGGHEYKPVKLPEGVVRFHMTRRTLKPVTENASASLFHLEDGVRLVEFHTKANALDADAMKIVRAAANNPGPGIIVHNDAQHFSAGVNLGKFLELIDAKNWSGIDTFLNEFQMAVEALLYCDVPVVGAPSGLSIGGGYEVLAHCDLVVAHANTVLGLVEATVGVVPGGGGVKETYLRWCEETGDVEKAAWKTFNQIGYSMTATSPDLAINLQYYLPDRDSEVMNRDRLVTTAQAAIKSLAQDYRSRERPLFHLAPQSVYKDMLDFLQNGRTEKKFMPHDVTVATAIAEIVTDFDGTCNGDLTERDMYGRERASFIKLAKTPETRERIASMLAGNLIRN